MAADRSLQRLHPLLASAEPNSLWLVDEHAFDAQTPRFPGRAISNRVDIAKQLQQSGVSSKFSDFDFSDIDENSQSAIFYRVSKEKPVVHWIINNAARLLASGGSLYLSGEKNDGIKTYIDKAAKLLGTKISAEKDGNSYLGIIEKTSVNTEKQLDDHQYPKMRDIGEFQGKPLRSKPGQFGWEKLDKGSELLINYLPSLLDTLPSPPKNLLDLGCGYGYISLHAHALLPNSHFIATDNNAAAIAACEENFRLRGIQGEVIADNCAQSLEEKFDLILCNPPFHQGFDVEGGLTQRFLNTCHRRLKPRGCGLFVVNQFIPLERLANPIFSRVTLLENNGSFKLVLLNL
ncbi:MAG: methyltransferase [Cellvibrionaceae bacterium]